MSIPKRSIPGLKDENGIYTPLPKSEPQLVAKPIVETDISVDHLMREVLINIAGILRAVKLDVGTGAPSREMVQNLKDCQSMLRDLKKDEKDLLDSLSDEELEKMIKK